MRKKIVCGIYKITSPSNKVYIGQSWDIWNRISVYKNIKCPNQPALFNSLNKYGFDNHIVNIIHEFPKDVSQTIIDSYEELYIHLYKSANVTMLNIKNGGSCGKHSPETIYKMKNKYKIILNTQTGIFYIGVKEAALSAGIRMGTLQAKLKGANGKKNNTSFIYA